MPLHEREFLPLLFSVAEETQEDGKTGSFGDGSAEIIGACIEVHRHLGPGLLERSRPSNSSSRSTKHRSSPT